MNGNEYLKVNCSVCGGGLEFERAHAGETIQCPHCLTETILAFTPQTKPESPSKQKIVARSLSKLHLFTVVWLVVLVVVVLGIGFIGMKMESRPRVSDGATTQRSAKAPVTGAAGFLLGGRLDELWEAKLDDDGGYSYHDTGLTNLPPFERIDVKATHDRIIYEISLDGYAQNEFRSTYSTLTNIFAEKYGFRYGKPYSGESASEVDFEFFGTADRSLSLSAIPKTGWITVTYSDDKVKTAFNEQKQMKAVEDVKHIAPSL